MLTTVAALEHVEWYALLDRPLWRVLFAFYHHMDRIARQALTARVARVDLGLMVAHAFNSPAVLVDELRRAQEAVASFDRGPEDTASELAMLRAAGEALAQRIEAGRVLAPEALLS